MLRRFTLALVIALIGTNSFGDTLIPETRFLLPKAGPDFGGLSGLLIHADGSAGTVLSDRGYLFPVTFKRAANGALIGISIGDGQSLNTFLGDEDRMDSEALAITRSGDLLVGFERPSRMETLTDGGFETAARQPFPNAGLRRGNKGLEALAAHPNGSMVVGLQETPAKGEDSIAIYALGSDEPAPIGHLPYDKPFQVTGADFGPDGRLYILERAFSFLGFRTRVRSLDLATPEIPPVTHFQSALGDYDNLEGISVWADTSGTTRVTLVSDDNFLSILRSEIVELVLQ